MVISMSELTRYFASAALALSLSGCVSTSSAQTDFGYKTIFIAPHTSVETFRKFLNDWQDFVEAVYEYRPKQCVLDNLKIDSVTSFGSYQGREREKYLSLAGITDSQETVKVLSIGTNAPCLADPNSSDPAWIVLYADGVYKVMDDFVISE